MMPSILGVGSLVLAATGLGYFLGLQGSRRRYAAVARARDAARRANEELRQVVETLEQLAGTDRLTGLWNRRRMEEGSATLIALAGRRGDPLSLIFFDLDHFKRVNDVYGHATGDAVLVTVAEVVRGQLRASDFLARWGGEEFLVLAAGTRLDGAVALAEKIRTAIAATVFSGVGSVTVSLGVAEYESGERLDGWIARGDEALYRAKEGGRNCVERALASKSVPEFSSKLPFGLIWDGDFASGQPQIDAQHRGLFDLSNQLFAAMDTGQSTADQVLLLRRLVAHIAQHFHDEEALLLDVGYAALPAHAAEHKYLMNSARALEVEMAAGRLDMGRMVAFLAVEVVRNHIIRGDHDYFPCFKPPPASNM